MHIFAHILDIYKPYECKHCDWKFKHYSKYYDHVKTHSKEANVICDICNKSLKSETILKTHKSIYHEERKEFICDICGHTTHR